MRRIIAPLCLLALLAACSSDSKTSTPGTNAPSGTTAPAGTSVGAVPAGEAGGTLTDLWVVVFEPADLAGQMTLADLQAHATSTWMCGGPWTLDSVGKVFTVMYEYGVMTDGDTSPAPVVGLSATVQGEYMGPGTYPADIRIATSTDESAGEGTMTIDDGQLSGTFNYSDLHSVVNGHWTCAGS